jgi:hypothetical protein
MAAREHYYAVNLRRNGAACGCTGPYATLADADAGAALLPRSNPRGARIVVRANGLREAAARAMAAYRGIGTAAQEAGRATQDVYRAGVEDVKAAPARAKRAAKTAVVKTLAAQRKASKIAAVEECVSRLEAMGLDVKLTRRVPAATGRTAERARMGMLAGQQRRMMGVADPFALTNPAPRGTEVQTLLFDAQAFNVGQAKSWAKRHGFRFGKTDTGGGRATHIRVRQHDPDDYTAGSFRTISLTEGVQAVIGVPRRARKNPTTTQIAVGAFAPEVVAAHAVAGLAARGVRATGRLASDAGSAVADLVAGLVPRKRRTNGSATADLSYTLREPEEDLRDYHVRVHVYRIGPVGHSRTRTDATVTTHETGHPEHERYDGPVSGLATALANGRLVGSAKRTRFRNKIVRDVQAARAALSPGET